MRARSLQWLKQPSIWRLVLPAMVGFLVVCVTTPGAQATTNETKRATFRISGLGLLGDLEMRKQIRLIQRDPKPPTVYNADQIEDILMIVAAKVRDDGYLKARVKAELTLTNASVQHYEWHNATEALLPRSLVATKIALHVQRGIRFYYDRLEIKGLHVLPLKAAREYFVSTEALLSLKGMRVYSPNMLQKSLDNLREALNRRGYENASVVLAHLERNDATGAVQVEVAVREGLPTKVRSVEIQLYAPNDPKPVKETTEHPNVPFSRLWQEDFTQGLRTNLYRRGYPDANAELSVVRHQTNATQITAELLAKVNQGTNIQLRAVRFEGPHHTRNSILEQFTHFPSGQPLNRLQAEQARERIARLGVFDTVGLRYDQVDAENRDIVYELKERKSFEVDLLFGYGAYDRLGGGFELIQRNVLGLAQQQDLKATQTFKSSLVDYRYTIPEAFGLNEDLFLTGSLLRREEISFTREEYGGSVGVHRFFPAAKLDANVRYDYEFLDAHASEFDVIDTIGVGNARASAIILELKHDRLDNPLAPRRGYKLFGNVEFASSALGGDVNYQRIQVGGATHFDLGGGRVVHLGLTHGLTFTWGGSSRELPFNKRFFPGGENSERGYQYGEAAPRNANGQVIGAETYLQGNAEFEQFLTRTISVVLFSDSVGIAASRRSYPFNELLYAVGGGLRWKTVIGPVRLEYGHNLNPRPHDPDGTIQFSFGFPF